MSGNLTEDQVIEFKAVFDYFKDGDDEIDKNVLPGVMRAMNQNPSEADIQKIKSEIDRDNSPPIDFKQFLYLVSQYLHSNDDELQLINTFNIFDKDQNG